MVLNFVRYAYFACIVNITFDGVYEGVIGMYGVIQANADAFATKLNLKPLLIINRVFYTRISLFST